MASLKDINPSVRHFAARLAARWPKFGRSLRVKGDGHFEAAVAAPKGSQAQVLACFSSGAKDVWLRLGMPHTFYPVETAAELAKIVELLLTDAAVFATIYRGTSWTGTTLVDAGRLPSIEPGETCYLYSWSGKKDFVIHRPGRSTRRRATRSVSPPKGAFDQTAFAHSRSTPQR